MDRRDVAIHCGPAEPGPGATAVHSSHASWPGSVGPVPPRPGKEVIGLTPDHAQLVLEIVKLGLTVVVLVVVALLLT
jgi:hypothetical protein